jgi:hypothetical protein
MHDTDSLFHLASMTVGDFRKFKRALAILERAGVPRASAIDTLIHAHHERNKWKRAA